METLHLIRMAAVGVAVCVATCGARGDEIVLHGGRSYEGVIVDESGGWVTIDTKVAGIRTELRFHRSRIERVERRPLAEGFWESAPARAGERAEPARPRGEGATPEGDVLRYLEVPVEGMFGVDVVAEGLRRALGKGTAMGVEHVVFVIDSPGGFLYEAERVAGVLREFSEEFTYHAVVENEAFSAATVFLAASEHIYFMPGAASGSAVAFTVSPDTGSAEVDAKLNAAWASKLAGAAAASGHPGILFRAMILRDLEVYTWEEDGERRYAGRVPEPAPAGLVRLDTDKTVLALSADDARCLGLAREIRAIDDIARLNDLGRWRPAGLIGGMEMRRAARDRAALIESVEEVRREVDAAIRLANETDPRLMTVTYREGSEMLSARDQAEWRRRTDEALAARTRLDRLLRRAIRLQEEAKEAGAMHVARPEYLESLERTRERNAEAARWLHSRRSATRISEIR